ncbi:alpha/beta fold hydrolase [Erwinia persicina]|uniref:alpha/beta fold hydrolase n=1 Tax=Erwinia persicina TaxID=55211 RepID=UPI0017832884|nr:alpha/beta hydrolase [Erwinia persicina]MBD8162632.1 alpha/beta hydrolase [Erwinia persicina]MBD8214724.1 alpha/beta hydrolase [Erwinia persicina]
MIAWHEAGSGPALVLLHGISSGSSSWHKQLNDPRLQGCCRILAWDAPGYGKSLALTEAEPAAERYAGALAQMLDDAGEQQVVLVGHSLGALIASAFAVSYPQRVKHLVLADPAQGYGRATVEKQQQVLIQRQQQLAGGLEKLAATRAVRLLRPDADERDVATVAAGMRRLNPSGFLQAVSLLVHEDIHGWLAKNSRPTEVWCGEMDTITPPVQAQDLARGQGFPYLPIPGAGHASYLDNAAFFNRQLRRVITGEENGSSH